MAEVITMPRLSDTMTEGKVAKWHKKVGDAVNEGDVLAEIETDKAVQDFESEVKGTLLYVGVAEGEGAPVDSILAIIGKEGEDISSLTSGGTTGAAEGLPEETKTEGNVTPVETTEPVEKESSSVEVPKGVEVITMPRLSDTMTEGKVAKWHKNVGDSVKEGDILAEIETDKAVQDFEAEVNGTLLYQGVKEGEGSAVDSVLAIIGPEGTDVSGLTSGAPKKQEKAAAVAAPTESTSQQAPAASDEESKGESSTEARIAISPLARKMAKEKGIDITQVKGSGENGRIVRKDIEGFTPSAAKSPFGAEAKTTAAPSAAQFAQAVVSGETTETPNSQVRNIIAKRLSESKFSAPHYYLIVEVNMDKAIAARKEINSLPDTKVSFNDMIIKATAMALRKHPQVNSSWAGDKIIHHGDINVGVAVAIPDGLVVPVLKNADYMNYTQISAAVKDMASRAKSKGLKANEMEGSTFSISNLGMFGIETFTSIINQPNSAILSVGAIVEKPVVKDGQIVVGNTMKLSMACDHRVIDGATGAEFLQTLRTYLEQPLTLLL